MSECGRCGGTGKTVWGHIENGICFACGGIGKLKGRNISKQAPVAVREQTSADYPYSYGAAQAVVVSAMTNPECLDVLPCGIIICDVSGATKESIKRAWPEIPARYKPAFLDWARARAW